MSSSSSASALFSGGVPDGIRKPVRYQFEGRTQPGSRSSARAWPGPGADEVELQRLDQPRAHLQGGGRCSRFRLGVVMRRDPCVSGCLGRALRRCLLAALLRRGGAGAGLFLRALGVELEQPRQHLVADLVGPAVAVGLLLVAPLLLVDLVVEEELAVGRDVAPAVGVEDGAVHGGVQLAELHDLRVALVGIVEAVVGLGQALVVLEP